MLRARPEGAVSIFLCGVLLILIVFSCTIIDVTRIQIARSQAERALQNASYSLLSSYDSHLQSQYGIFAKNLKPYEIFYQQLDGYIQPTLNPNLILQNSKSNGKIFNPRNPGFQLYQFEINDYSLERTFELLSYDYLKLQIVEYMKPRVPLIVLEPFLDKLEILGKASKTTEIIQQKNDFDREVGKLEAKFYKLEGYIEGMIADPRGGELKTNSEGKLSLYPNYIKKMMPRGIGKNEIYSKEEIPLEELRLLLNQNAWILMQDHENYLNTLDRCEDALHESMEAHLAILELNEEKSERKKEVASLRREEGNDQNKNKIKRLKEEIKSLEEEIKSEEEKRLKAGLFFKEEDRKLYREILPKIKQIIMPYQKNESYGNKGLLEAAILEIEGIKKESPIIFEKLVQLKEGLLNQDGTYMESTCGTILSEIERIEKSLGIDSTGDMKVLNQLSSMEEKLRSNLSLISEIEGNILGLENFKEQFYHFWLYSFACNEEEFSIREFLNTRNSDGNPLFPITYRFDYEDAPPGGNPKEGISSELDKIVGVLKDYTREFYFDYEKKEVALRKDFDFSDFLEIAETIFPGIDIPFDNLLVPDEALPSKLKGISENRQEESLAPLDYVGSNHYLNQLQQIGEGIPDDFDDLINGLYINEYIIGMFAAADDHQQDDMGEEIEAMTINHYPKSKHYLNYEVEYILFGQKLDHLNVLSTIALIFSIRIALNTIYLISDLNKINQIANAATAIAGWWSLGIGSVGLTVVLTLIWSIVESISDIQKLLAGEAVPILKTSDTWETDILNGIIHIAEEVVADQAGVKEEDKDYLPSFTYKDYLRVFLLSGMIKEEAKLFRVMDLVQINLSKERGEDVVLSDYSTAFEVKANFQVNKLFINLPMKNQYYYFERKVRASY